VDPVSYTTGGGTIHAHVGFPIPALKDPLDVRIERFQAGVDCEGTDECLSTADCLYVT
jgi:hypothetical protein